MSHQAYISEDQTYIICEVTSDVTREVARDFNMTVDALSRRSHIKRFLIDVRSVKNVMGTGENYNFTYKSMKAMELQRDVRVATLVGIKDSSHHFLETLARNAGYNMRIFRDEGAALKWLLEADAKTSVDHD